MLKRVQIPDVLPSDLPQGSNFSLVAGDFEEVYGQQDGEPDADEPSAGQWDAILTCFFIDTVNAAFSFLRERSLTIVHAGKKHSELPSHHPSDSRSRRCLDQFGWGMDACIVAVMCFISSSIPQVPSFGILRKTPRVTPRSNSTWKKSKRSRHTSALKSK